MTNTKKDLFNQLDSLMTDIGYAGMRVDELLGGLNKANLPNLYPAIFKNAEQITADLTASISKFNAEIERIKSKI